MSPTNPSQASGPSPVAIFFPTVTFAIFGILFFGGIGAAVGGTLGVAIGSIGEKREIQELSGQASGPSPIAIFFPAVTFAIFRILFFGGIGAAVGGTLGVAIGSIREKRETRESSTDA